jgi:hypothetical protein
MIKKRTRIPKTIQQAILNRTKGVCELCNNKWEKLQPLQFHHIDDDATNHSLENIILLCASCHRRTQDYREEWRSYFSSGTFDISNNKHKETFGGFILDNGFIHYMINSFPKQKITELLKSL